MHKLFFLSRKPVGAGLLLSFCLILTGCETGHLWSLYSLGFTQRDAYLDNLGDARDTLSSVVQQIQPVVATEANQAKEQRKVINAADRTLDDFLSQIKTAERIGGSWIKQWQEKPEKFIEQEYGVTDVKSSQRLLLQQARDIAEQMHGQMRKPKAADLAALLVYIEAAQNWLVSVDQHVDWLESSDSGYPIHLSTTEQ